MDQLLFYQLLVQLLLKQLLLKQLLLKQLLLNQLLLDQLLLDQLLKQLFIFYFISYWISFCWISYWISFYWISYWISFYWNFKHFEGELGCLPVRAKPNEPLCIFLCICKDEISPLFYEISPPPTKYPHPYLFLCMK